MCARSQENRICMLALLQLISWVSGDATYKTTHMPHACLWTAPIGAWSGCCMHLLDMTGDGHVALHHTKCHHARTRIVLCTPKTVCAIFTQPYLAMYSCMLCIHVISWAVCVSCILQAGQLVNTCHKKKWNVWIRNLLINPVNQDSNLRRSQVCSVPKPPLPRVSPCAKSRA